jgi:hypothetical protein
MVALMLYAWLGPRAALAELMGEILIGLAVTGGGGGRRIRRTVRLFLDGMRRRQPVAI